MPFSRIFGVFCKKKTTKTHRVKYARNVSFRPKTATSLKRSHIQCRNTFVSHNGQKKAALFVHILSDEIAKLTKLDCPQNVVLSHQLHAQVDLSLFSLPFLQCLQRTCYSSIHEPAWPARAATSPALPKTRIQRPTSCGSRPGGGCYRQVRNDEVGGGKGFICQNPRRDGHDWKENKWWPTEGDKFLNTCLVFRRNLRIVSIATQLAWNIDMRRALDHQRS